MKTKANRHKGLLKIITIPLRALGKARDFYVRSLISCANRGNYGCNVMAMPSAHSISTVPRSFSVISSESYEESEDLRELIRAASTRTLANRADVRLCKQQQQKMMRLQQPHKMPPRSWSVSVGMGRIDEDKPCIFGEDNVSLKKEFVYPRSKSYAVAKRSIVF